MRGHEVRVPVGAALLAEHQHQLGQVNREQDLQLLQLCLVEPLELGEVGAPQALLHVPDVREVAHRQAPLLGDVFVDRWQACEQTPLLPVLAEGWHLPLQVVQQVGVDPGQTRPLDEVGKLPDRRALRQAGQLRVEVVLLRLEKPPLLVVGQRLVPKGAHKHARDLRRVYDLAQVPHHGAVHAHELGRGDPVCLVQQETHLVAVRLCGDQHPLELVTDVHFANIEEHKDHVCTVCEPSSDRIKIVATHRALLVAGEDARRVDERDVLQEGAVDLRALELVQEAGPKALQHREGKRLVRRCCIARHDPLRVAVHHGHELVGRRLRADAHALVVAAEQVPDEGGLARGVLAQEEHHGSTVEVMVLEEGRVVDVEVVVLLNGQELLPVQPVHAIRRIGKFPDLLSAPLVLGQPSEHGSCYQKGALSCVRLLAQAVL
mmetsp:Transcript_7763/g.21549  ORF Transcript_7763/g.21549 Transcript_7763/m.21549 type:complete len:433 (-) Transcript_7763:54-1352(-)